MFSTHISILAQVKCIAQVLRSFDPVEPCLSVGVSPAFNAAQDRKPRPFRESFGERVGLIESSFSKSSRVKGHRDQIIRRYSLDARILHGVE